MALPPGAFLQASAAAEKIMAGLVLDNLGTLPPRARVITVGQGFVREGDAVTPVEDPDGDATRLGAAHAPRRGGRS